RRQRLVRLAPRGRGPALGGGGPGGGAAAAAGVSARLLGCWVGTAWGPGGRGGGRPAPRGAPRGGRAGGPGVAPRGCRGRGGPPPVRTGGRREGLTLWVSHEGVAVVCRFRAGKVPADVRAGDTLSVRGTAGRAGRGKDRVLLEDCELAGAP